MFVRSLYKKALPSVSAHQLNILHKFQHLNDNHSVRGLKSFKMNSIIQFRQMTKTTSTPPPQGQQPPSQLQQAQHAQNKLAFPERKPTEIAKASSEEMDMNGKKLGWIISGSAICLISALYGKMYMLFGAVPLFLYHSKDIDVMSKTFNRDVQFLWRHSKCWLLAKRIKNEDLTLPTVFNQVSKKHADKMMLQMHDQNWKYKDVASYANRTSRLMQKYGFQKGDVVAMLTLNSPEMVAILLGLANIGIITALINTDLRNEGLTQAITNSRCKGIIFDDELMHAFGDVYKHFDAATIFQMRHKAKRPEFRVLEEELLKECNDLPEMFVNIHHEDPLLYLYSPDDSTFTEPIVISHEKFLFDSSATALMLDLKPSDKIYNPTPLHETTGMILGIGPSITNAVPTVLRSKFSAADYFKECYVYNCTVGQYAGSMCKHLLLSQVSPIETFHPVKVMYGSGLDSDYWQEFVNRFGTKMYEVHDASHNNTNLINMEGKIGVVGFRPKLAPSFLFPHYVIKVFGKEKIPVRDAHGFCQLCDYGEPGMLIRLWNGKDPLPNKATKIQNIFKNGDVGVTHGEMLTIDENLYLRPLKKHVDKSWMNKLVTSEEVEYIASRLTSKRCVAYGLALGYKQEIEILAIEDPNKTLDMKKFTDDLVDHLPKNWVPHYVRIVQQFEQTDANQVDKQKLIDQGMNMIDNLVYYFDKNSMSYKPLMWAKSNRPQIVVNESTQIHNLTEAGTVANTAGNMKSTVDTASTPELISNWSTDKVEKVVERGGKKPVRKMMVPTADLIAKMFANISDLPPNKGKANRSGTKKVVVPRRVGTELPRVYRKKRRTPAEPMVSAKKVLPSAATPATGKQSGKEPSGKASTDSKTAAAKPMDTKMAVSKPADTRLPDAKIADMRRATDAMNFDGMAVMRPAETKLPDVKDVKMTDPNVAEAKGVGTLDGIENEQKRETTTRVTSDLYAKTEAKTTMGDENENASSSKVSMTWSDDSFIEQQLKHEPKKDNK